MQTRIHDAQNQLKVVDTHYTTRCEIATATRITWSLHFSLIHYKCTFCVKPPHPVPLSRRSTAHAGFSRYSIIPVSASRLCNVHTISSNWDFDDIKPFSDHSTPIRDRYCLEIWKIPLQHTTSINVFVFNSRTQYVTFVNFSKHDNVTMPSYSRTCPLISRIIISSLPLPQIFIQMVRETPKICVGTLD